MPSDDYELLEFAMYDLQFATTEPDISLFLPKLTPVELIMVNISEFLKNTLLRWYKDNGYKN